MTMERESPFFWTTLSSSEIDLLETVFWHRQTTRSSLSHRTGFSQSKINSAVANLLALHLLEEVGMHTSTGGRKPTLLRLSPSLGILVAIDLGATSFDLALLTPELRLLARFSEAANVSVGPGPMMARIKRALKEQLRAKQIPIEQILAIGIGVPGPVEFHTGLLVHPPIMPGWEGYPISDHLRREFGAPVYVDNDANIMALGELWRRPGRGRSFNVVKVGTGIGTGIICQGSIYRGANGAAGEIGHICLDPQGSLCYCGNKGCLVSMASGPAIEQMALEAARSGESPALAHILRQNGQLTSVDVSSASLDGDPVASSILQHAGHALGQTLASLVNFFNPSYLLIGGGVTKSGPIFLAALRQRVYQFSNPLSTRHLEISYTSLGDDAGVTGAAVLALLETLHGAKKKQGSLSALSQEKSTKEVTGLTFERRAEIKQQLPAPARKKNDETRSRTTHPASYRSTEW
jgi:glucokinase-like ROK family protein